LVGWWWGLWVVTSLLSNANFRLSMRAESIDDFRTTTMLDLIIGPLSVVGALLFIRLIQSITKAQRDASPGLAAVFA
jgi:Trk-type K+ transport system membrane component